MVVAPLLGGAAYFMSVAPASQPGLYVFTTEAHAYPLSVAFAVPGATLVGESHFALAPVLADLPEAVLPTLDPRPAALYVLRPEHATPPIDPASLGLYFFAFNTEDPHRFISDLIPMPTTVRRVNDSLFRVECPLLDQFWVRERFFELLARQSAPSATSRPFLMITVRTGDGYVRAYPLPIQRLW